MLKRTGVKKVGNNEDTFRGIDMTLTADDAVIRALRRQVDDPSRVHQRQASRDGFVELLLELAGSEDDDRPVVVTVRPPEPFRAEALA